MIDTIQIQDVMMLSHCLVGLVAAQVAQRKGYDLGVWLLWGLFGGTVALVDAMRRPESGY